MEKKKNWFQRLKAWLKEQNQMRLRRNIIKKIAKLTPVGDEIPLETFLGKEKQPTRIGWASSEDYYKGQVTEESYPFAEKCQHGTIKKGNKVPSKIEYPDGSVTEIRIIGNEECQKAFRELYERQLYGVASPCPHCKKTTPPRWSDDPYSGSSHDPK